MAMTQRHTICNMGRRGRWVDMGVLELDGVVILAVLVDIAVNVCLGTVRTGEATI